MLRRVLTAALFIFYPVAVYAALRYGGVRIAALVAAVILGYRLLGRLRDDHGLKKILVLECLAIAAIIVFSMIFNSDLMLRLVPAGISIAILSSFGLSLFSDKPLVERFARIKKPDLPGAEVAYCRTVTWVWTVFLFFNTLAVLYVAIFASREVWALYCGLVGYVLIGLLFSIEYVIRRLKFG